MPIPRQALIRRNRTRRKKLKLLKKHFRAVKTKEDKAKIQEKASRVSPGIILG